MSALHPFTSLLQSHFVLHFLLDLLISVLMAPSGGHNVDSVWRTKRDVSVIFRISKFNMVNVKFKSDDITRT